MNRKAQLNQAVIMFFVYLINICQPVWAQSCSTFYSASEATFGMNRIDNFFIATRSFANLVERLNGFQVDDKGSDYQKFVSELVARITKHVKDIETVIGEKEIILISTVASRGDLVIKFIRSKTHILFPMNRVERERKYDYKWDRDYIVETRHKFKDLTSLFLNMKTELDEFRPIDSVQTICRSAFCRFFQPRKATSAVAPEVYQKLTTDDKTKVQKLYKEYLSQSNNSFKWSRIKDQDGKRLRASDYKRFGLNQYLGARRIPKERWPNYRVNTLGEIEVNIVSEPFEYTPWGSDKSFLIADIASDYQMVKNFSESGDPKLLFTNFIKSIKSDIDLTKLSYLASEFRNNIFKWMIQLNTEVRVGSSILNESLKKLATQLEQDHQQNRDKQRQLFATIRAQSHPNIDNDYFEIEGIRFPIVSESSLSNELREYLEIDFNLTKANGSYGNHPKRLDEYQSLFRAIFNSESDQIKFNGYFDISPNTNFEPMYGFQVNHFKSRDGYLFDSDELTHPIRRVDPPDGDRTAI